MGDMTKQDALQRFVEALRLIVFIFRKTLASPPLLLSLHSFVRCLKSLHWRSPPNGHGIGVRE